MKASRALPDLLPDPVWRRLKSSMKVVNPEQRVPIASGFSCMSVQMCFHLPGIRIPQIFMIQGWIHSLYLISVFSLLPT